MFSPLRFFFLLLHGLMRRLGLAASLLVLVLGLPWCDRFRCLISFVCGPPLLVSAQHPFDFSQDACLEMPLLHSHQPLATIFISLHVCSCSVSALIGVEC